MIMDQRLADISGIEYSLRKQSQSARKVSVADQSQVHKDLRTITYTINQFRCTKVKANHDKKLKIIGSNAVNTIRKTQNLQKKY